MAALTALRLDSVPAGSDTTVTSPPCATFMVTVPPTSAYGVLVNIIGIQLTGTGHCVSPGQTQPFRKGCESITTVVLQGDGGTATNVTYGAVSRMP
jgi:hypothetical protein